MLIFALCKDNFGPTCIFQQLSSAQILMVKKIKEVSYGSKWFGHKMSDQSEHAYVHSSPFHAVRCFSK